MFAKFDAFLSENQRATATGKLYSKFGQVVIMLGEAKTSFSKRYADRVTLKQLYKMGELQETFHSRIKAEIGKPARYFDLSLTENIGTANLLMQDVYESLPINDVSLHKSQLLAVESRLPTMVFDATKDDINWIVENAVKLGYKSENVHVVINESTMDVELAESERIIPDRISFGGVTSKELLESISDIELGDVYVAFQEAKCPVQLEEVSEIQIKHRKTAMKVSEMNRHVLNHVIAKPSADSDFGINKVDGPVVEGFKAYEFHLPGERHVFESSVFATPTIVPMTESGWNKLADTKLAYFSNGWKMQQNNRRIVFTEAKDALRSGKRCTEYVFELKEPGYPLLDVLTMCEGRFSIDAIARSIPAMNGRTTPDFQTATAFVTEVESNRVYHPGQAHNLRPATQMNSLNDLVRAISNKQFNEFVVEHIDTDTMLSENSIDSLVEHIVSNGVEMSQSGNEITFDITDVKYKIKHTV
ncbi:hypothetical protein VPHD479_0169 [Vibrio phage D479]